MGNYTNFGGFENPGRGAQARNLKTNVPKILDLKSSSEQILYKNCRWVPGGGGILPYITYTGKCRPKGSWFWSSWFRMGYRLKRRFLERSIIFRMHKSSSFVSSHLLFKDRLLLKIQFTGFTSKLLCSCCTLCFSMQGGRILVLAASADSAILDK